MLFHLQINWRWGRYTQIFYDLRHHITWAYFTVVIGSQIVVLPTIPPSQWHFRDLNLWPWLWYHLLDCEICHSTSKPIDDEEDTQIFYDFRHHTMRVCFRVTIGSQIVVPQQLIFFFTTTFSSSICICYLRIEALFFVIWDLLLKNRFLFSFDIYMPIIHACMSFFSFFFFLMRPRIHSHEYF